MADLLLIMCCSVCVLSHLTVDQICLIGWGQQLKHAACIQDHVELTDYKRDGKRERFSLWRSPWGLSPSRKPPCHILSHPVTSCHILSLLLRTEFHTNLPDLFGKLSLWVWLLRVAQRQKRHRSRRLGTIGTTMPMWCQYELILSDPFLIRIMLWRNNHETKSFTLNHMNHMLHWVATVNCKFSCSQL